MRPTSIIAAIAVASLTVPTTGRSRVPEIVVSDVDRFYEIYDAAGGHPSANDLQRLYIDAGSAGMRDFVRLRGLTGANLSAAIEADPRPFEGARRCVATLPRVRTRLINALRTLGARYPRAVFPPVTVLIGRAKTGGTTSRAGVLIGIETLCGVDFLEANREDRMVHLIAHEYAHVQQPAAEATDSPGTTVLFASLIEGGAEFVAELVSGGVSYSHLRTWTKGREREIIDRLIADRDRTDLDGWLYQGFGTPDRPGDLGYWAGYWVTKAYYDRATDKRQALAAIIGVTQLTAGDILLGSGLLKAPHDDKTTRLRTDTR